MEARDLEAAAIFLSDMFEVILDAFWEDFTSLQPGARNDHFYMKTSIFLFVNEFAFEYEYNCKYCSTNSSL